MKISQLFIFTIMTIVFGFTSGVSILEDPPSFLQRFVQSLESQRKTGSTSFHDIAASSLMKSLSQDYDVVLSYNADQTKQHVFKREAPYRSKFRARWHKVRCVKDKYGRCIILSKCGFKSPINIVESHRRLGCRRLQTPPHRLG